MATVTRAEAVAIAGLVVASFVAGFQVGRTAGCPECPPPLPPPPVVVSQPSEVNINLYLSRDEDCETSSEASSICVPAPD